MKKQLLIAALILAICITVAFVLIIQRPEPEKKPVETKAPLVQTVKAKYYNGALTVEGAGTVRPQDEVVLTAEVAGKVMYVHPALSSGSYVKAGEVLVRIDSMNYHNALEQAKADVAQQEVAVIEAQEEYELARTEYEQFQARGTHQKMNPFASIDGSDYAAGVPLPVQQGQQSASPEKPGRLVFREPQLRAAEAARNRAVAQRSDAELALKRTVVRAPFSGYVRSKSIARGAYVSPGQGFANLVATDVLEVNVPLTRKEASLIPDLWVNHTANRIPAAVYANYGQYRYVWDGYIDRVETILDPETRTINAVVRVVNPRSGGNQVIGTDRQVDGPDIVPTKAPPLLVGEFVQVKLQGAELDGYIKVPQKALRPDNSVLVVRDNTIHIVPVRVLQKVEAWAYVISAEIQHGEPVIITDLGVATEGMQVRLAESNSATQLYSELPKSSSKR